MHHVLKTHEKSLDIKVMFISNHNMNVVLMFKYSDRSIAVVIYLKLIFSYIKQL